MKNALLSAYRKDENLITLAEILLEKKWALIASAGTFNFLSKKKIPVTNVSEIVGGEPILSHKVATLSREVMAGLLVDRSNHAEMQEMKNLHIPVIDLVYVDTYPLREAVRDETLSEEVILQKTDIGGPTLLRAAAKGGRYIIIGSEEIPDFCRWFIGEMRAEEVQKFMRVNAEAFCSRYSQFSEIYWEKKLPRPLDLLSN
jgi:phosphoribosylaminoimidazolecarboxamide formyltransferase / IMP cyclohydrolase